MQIEDQIFKKEKLNLEKLEQYGFKKEKEEYKKFYKI